MNWKWLGFIIIIEKTDYFQNIRLALNLSMLFNNLCKEHLPNSNHTSPSCVWDIWTNNFVWKLRESRSICEPRSRLKDIVNFLLHFKQVVFCYNELLSQNIYLIFGRSKFVAIVLFKEFQEIVLCVVCDILNFLSQVKCPFIVFFHSMYFILTKNYQIFIIFQ